MSDQTPGVPSGIPPVPPAAPPVPPAVPPAVPVVPPAVPPVAPPVQQPVQPPASVSAPQVQPPVYAQAPVYAQPPANPQAPVYAQPGGYAPPPAGPRATPVWPFLVGGGVLLLLLIIVAIGAVFFVTQLSSAGNAESDRETVEATVVAFDESYRDADCDDYEAVTSSTFRDDAMQESDDQDFDCDVWEEGAESLTIDGEYAYAVEVNDVTVSGDGATVLTTETLNDEPIDYEYQLERTGAGWVIVSYESQ